MRQNDAWSVSALAKKAYANIGKRQHDTLPSGDTVSAIIWEDDGFGVLACDLDCECGRNSKYGISLSVEKRQLDLAAAVAYAYEQLASSARERGYI